MSPLFITAVIAVALVFGVRYFRLKQQEARIDQYRFPPSLVKKVGNVYPHLSAADLQHVMEGLREYFHICNQAEKKPVAMPSQVVDVAWHEFILFTKAYSSFCQQCLGRFLHHTPAEAMQSPTRAQEGIKVAWRTACHREDIDRDNPQHLPMLFALDRVLKIANGFHYSLDCKKQDGSPYCASHIDCSTDCSGDSSDCSSDSGCSGCGGD